MRALFAPVLLAVLASLAPPATAEPGAMSFMEAAPPSFEAALNAVRAQAGLGGLRSDRRLARAAAAHAADMAAHAYVSHTGRNGSNAQARAQASGCRGGYIAENIAWGQDTAGDVFVGWMNSPPHHRNMMGRPYGVYGLAEADGTWVLMFADRC